MKGTRLVTQEEWPGHCYMAIQDCHGRFGALVLTQGLGWGMTTPLPTLG